MANYYIFYIYIKCTYTLHIYSKQVTIYVYFIYIKAMWSMKRLGDWKICLPDLILPLTYPMSFESQSLHLYLQASISSSVK